MRRPSGARAGSACARRGSGRRRRAPAPPPRSLRGHAGDWRTPASTLGTNGTRRLRRAARGRARPPARAGSPPPRRKPYASLPASSTMPCTSKQSVERVEVAGRRVGRRGGGHVEEAVEVDRAAPRARAAQQLGRRRALQRLVQRVGGGERVVHGVPVAVVVLHVEAGDAQRGRVRDRAAELLFVGARARARRAARRRHARDRRRAAASRARRHVGEPRRAGSRRRRARRRAGSIVRCDERGEVVRVAPLAELLGPGGRRGLRTSVGRMSAAASLPRCSTASNALLVKSMVWPPSMNT